MVRTKFPVSSAPKQRTGSTRIPPIQTRFYRLVAKGDIYDRRWPAQEGDEIACEQTLIAETREDGQAVREFVVRRGGVASDRTSIVRRRQVPVPKHARILDVELIGGVKSRHKAAAHICMRGDSRIRSSVINLINTRADAQLLRRLIVNASDGSSGLDALAPGGIGDAILKVFDVALHQSDPGA